MIKGPINHNSKHGNMLKTVRIVPTERIWTIRQIFQVEETEDEEDRDLADVNRPYVRGMKRKRVHVRVRWSRQKNCYRYHKLVQKKKKNVTWRYCSFWVELHRIVSWSESRSPPREHSRSVVIRRREKVSRKTKRSDQKCYACEIRESRNGSARTSGKYMLARWSRWGASWTKRALPCPLCTRWSKSQFTEEYKIWSVKSRF